MHRNFFALVSFQLVLQILSLCRSSNYLQYCPKQTKSSQVSSKSKLLVSEGAFSSLDKDGNGRLSMFEIMSSPKEIITHSPLTTSFFSRFKTLASGDTTRERVLLEKLGNLITIPDALIMLTLFYFYKPVMKGLYRIIHFRSNEIDRPPYSKSLIGHLEGPIGYLVWFPPFLYTIDFLTIFIEYLGLASLIKGDIPRLACSISAAVVAGSFMTRIKDWICYRWRNTSYLDNNKPAAEVAKSRDVGKDKITDELTSTVIWSIVVAFCLEVASSELGVGLGSLFALGGIGSASFVLALRSSMENLVGGLLLKLQDKFRVGEKVTLAGNSDEGVVEEIGLLSTKLRKDDDSHLTVPNAQFIQGEVINWSRTPYRLFRTMITVKESNILLLSSIIQSIKETLEQDEGVESQHRDLIVSATGFNSGSVIVEINARLKGSNDHEISLVKTRVVDKIASSVDAIYNAKGKLYA